MGNLICIKLSLKGIELRDLHLFFTQWNKIHDIESLKACMGDNEPLFFDTLSFESMMDDTRIVATCCKILTTELEPKSVAGLKALYYLKEDIGFSENYETIYKENLNRLKMLYKKHPMEYMEEVSHILNKSSAFENILQSLYVLGYSNFAEDIIKKYDLDGCFEWLGDARSRELFLKDDVCGYHMVGKDNPKLTPSHNPILTHPVN